MNALVRKEIRALLPVWLVALALLIVPEVLVWIATHNRVAPADPFLVWFFAFAVLIVSLTSFGQEFNAGTFSILLAQPIPRIRIWRAKVGVLTVALLSITLIFLAGFWIRPIALQSGSGSLFGFSLLLAALVVMCGMSGGLWASLLLRQVTLAFWITLMGPGLVAILVAAITKNDSHLILNSSVAFALYAVAGFFFARRLFLRAQDVPWSGGNIPVPRLRKFGVLSGGWAPGGAPLRTLILKEVQFHHVSIMMAFAIYTVQIAFIVVTRILHPVTISDSYSLVLAGIGFLFWGAIPFLLGSIAVAEERKLGTLESQLCLPLARAVQCLVKYLTAVLLSVLLCAAIPFLIDTVATSSGWRYGLFAGGDRYTALMIIVVIVASITSVSFYVSTLARNTLQAMGVAVLATCGAGWFVIWCIHPQVIFMGQSAGYGPLFGLIGGPALVIGAAGLALGNYGSPLVDLKRWGRNVFVLLAVFATSLTATALTYHRTWELFMNLEPAHGPARLSGPIAPKILQFGAKIFVLLPDGRLWASGHTQNKVLYRFVQGGEVKEANTTVPLDGEFLGPKWVCISGRFAAPVGIQADGSLWKIGLNRTNTAAAPEMKRVGSDSDWKSATAGGGFYLAVKSDGTLWGWGDTRYGTLGAGSSGYWEDPRQISTNEDWEMVYADYNLAIGIKHDGSVWKWGQLQFDPRGEFNSSGKNHPEPLRWALDASDWVKHTGNMNCDLVVRRDGTMWVAGALPEDIFGESSSVSATSTFRRVGRESDWADVEMGGNQLVALRKNGSFIQADLYRAHFFFRFGQKWQPSKHSDWIAVMPDWGELTLGLAADGTLSCWFRGFESGNAVTEYLGPIRAPFWSLNILEASK